MSPRMLHVVENPDHIIRDDEELRANTGFGREQFVYELEMLEGVIMRDKLAPKFREWSYETSWNRCRLRAARAARLYHIRVGQRVAVASCHTDRHEL